MIKQDPNLTIVMPPTLKITKMTLERHPDAQRPEDMKLRALGYWASPKMANVTAFGLDYSQSHLPLAQDFVDTSWNKNERAQVARYLERGHEKFAWRGWSNCRFCQKHNGSRCLTDDVYVWPEGFSHYLKEHGVKPDDEFIQHVARMSRPRDWKI